MPATLFISLFPSLCSPLLVHKQLPYEIFGKFRCLREEIFVELVIAGHNVGVGLLLGVPEEGRRPRQPEEEGEKDREMSITNFDLGRKVASRPDMDSQDVRDDPDAPHVRVEGEGLVVDDLRADKLRRAQHLADLLARLDLPAEAEVNQLEERTAAMLQHNVLRLQVNN